MRWTDQHNTSRARLYDSETNGAVTADELGITDERYEELCAESLASAQSEGHVRINGRRVYAC